MTTARVYDVAFDWLVEQDVDQPLPDDARQQLRADLDRWRDLLVGLRERRVLEKDELVARRGRTDPQVKQAGARIMAVQNRLSEVNQLRHQSSAPTVETALQSAVVRAAVRWRLGENDGSELLSAVDGLIAFRGRRAS